MQVEVSDVRVLFELFGFLLGNNERLLACPERACLCKAGDDHRP